MSKFKMAETILKVVSAIFAVAKGMVEFFKNIAVLRTASAKAAA
jgi:hypothetical protein